MAVSLASSEAAEAAPESRREAREERKFRLQRVHLIVGAVLGLLRLFFTWYLAR